MTTPLVIADLLAPTAFVAARARLEREVISIKAQRRLSVGPLTFLFENRATCAWQVHEMCRVENLVRPDAIQHELDTYNALLPNRTSLSATMLVEVESADERPAVLAGLVGLHEHVALHVDGRVAVAQFDAEQFDERRISSVQFVRFPVDEALLSALADLKRPAELVVDHPAMTQRVPLPLALRAALIEDLAG